MDGEGLRYPDFKERAEKFSAWFRQTLAERGLSQSDVARRFYEQDDSHPMTAYRTRVNEWFHGRAVPRSHYAERLALALGVDGDYVLGLAGLRGFEVEERELSDRQLEVMALVKAADFTDDQWAAIVNMFEFWRTRNPTPAPGTNHDGG